MSFSLGIERNVRLRLADLRRWTIDKQLKLLKEFPWQKDGCSLVYQSLLEHLSVREILQWNDQLPSSCLNALNDRGLASEASYLYSLLSRKHHEEEEVKETWMKIWIQPVVDALDRSNSLHRALIAEYILPKLLKSHGEYFSQLKSMTSNCRTWIVCTRIGRSLGLCPDLFSSLDDCRLLRQGLTSADEQICLDCLFILCESPRTTEPIRPIEFDLLKEFLEMNIDNGSTSFRNQTLSLLKKHFNRMRESSACATRQKRKDPSIAVDDLTSRYRLYLHWLTNWCSSHLYLEGSYSQRHLAIFILHALEDSSAGLMELLSDASMSNLFDCLWDTYEDIRQCALDLLVRLNRLTKNDEDLRVDVLFDRVGQLFSSHQPPETATGATLIQCFARLSLLGGGRASSSDDQLFLLVDQIRQRLKDELQRAKVDLFQAAKNGPMYGSLSGINALLNIFTSDEKNIERWREVFTDLIEISLDIAVLTGPIVSSSSPEGMMPMELTNGKRSSSSSFFRSVGF